MPDTAAEAVAELLGALAHPDRIRLVTLLGEEERGVAELAEALELSQPRTSQHLALLRSHHVVSSRREGRQVFYRLTRPELTEWLAGSVVFLEQDAERASALGDRLRRLAARLQAG